MRPKWRGFVVNTEYPRERCCAHQESAKGITTPPFGRVCTVNAVNEFSDTGYEFMFTAAPMNVTGTPLNPLAVF